MKKTHIVSLLTAFVLFSGFAAVHAAEDLKVSGWVPYWRLEEGIKNAKSHLSDLDTVHPFGWSVKTDGTLEDMAKLSSRDWTRFFRSARSKDVEILPTVMWSDGANIHRILSDDDLREDHIDEIVSAVRKGKFDGVDIDYEAKKTETINYFSEFLEELKDELGSRELSCTIEARTPPESLYRVIPNPLQYANDYNEIADHCDRVQIMTYDQGRADIELNEERTGMPYSPVADADWVEKVIKLTTKTIPNDKLMLGVATYGYEYEVSVAPNWFKDYKRLWSFNPKYATDLAKENKITPSTNKGGEMSFSYFASTSPFRILSSLPVDENVPESEKAAAQALLFANATGMTVPVNYVVWSDALAIKQKIDLAREYDLRGVSIFKIDGAEDQKLWSEF